MRFLCISDIKERVSRMQNGNSFPNFAEAKPLFERSSESACLRASDLSTVQRYVEFFNPEIAVTALVVKPVAEYLIL